MESRNITSHDGLTSLEKKQGHNVDTHILVDDKYLAIAFLIGAYTAKYNSFGTTYKTQCL